MFLTRKALAVVLAMVAMGFSAMMPGPAPAQQAPVTLKKADYTPLSNSRAAVSKWWADEVEKRTGGKVKIQYFPAETLLKAADIFEGTRSGVADIGIWVQAYNPAVSPISALFTLPGISPTFRPAIRAVNELVYTGDFSLFRDELRKLGVEPLYSWGVADQELISTKPVASLASLKGLKVRVIGREWPKLVSAHGGTPVAMPWPEVYEALSRGTLDANVGFVTANRDSKLYEVAKHHTRVRLGAPAGPLAIMNKAAWDRLPAEAQKTMREVGREFTERLADAYDREVQEAMKEMEAKGVRFYDWSAEDRAKLQASMESVWDGWAKEMEAKGIPGREAMRRYLDLQKKHSR